MSDADNDIVVFDETIALAFAELACADIGAPGPELRRRLLDRVTEPRVPAGFAFRYDRDQDWLAHPVPGIRMKVLALDRQRGCATLLFDVAPGTRFPAHRHTGGAEECYVISGSLFTCGRRFTARDFIHADAETDHEALWTDEGCRVLLVVPREDYMPDPASKTD